MNPRHNDVIQLTVDFDSPAVAQLCTQLCTHRRMRPALATPTTRLTRAGPLGIEWPQGLISAMLSTADRTHLCLHLQSNSIIWASL